MKSPGTQTVIHSYLTLHMIDDLMTLLDPVEEFMSFGQQRHQRAGPLLTGPSGRLCGRGRLVGEEVLLFRQRHHGKSAATPLSSVAGSQLNAIYFESSFIFFPVAPDSDRSSDANFIQGSPSPVLELLDPSLLQKVAGWEFSRTGPGHPWFV
ncbi:hypothetical protein ILYODFUR_038632 [Ilyodon furcidens]|uniref:Uncharacterized protein n=1 Tax=Ilyodon furcidens TaxID=33524 RepID=A0ABV0UEN2_9TELE